MQSSILNNFKTDYQVICFGEALIDRLLPVGADILTSNTYEDCFGGAPANVACALARLGINTAFCGRFGKDLAGKNFLELMKKRGINLSLVQTDSLRSTRIVLVKRNLSGERMFNGFFGDQGNGFADTSLSVQEIKKNWHDIALNAKWLLIGSIPLASTSSSEALLWTLKEARKLGLKVALDINWRPIFWNNEFSSDTPPDCKILEKIEPLIQNCSLLKVAKEEAIWFFKSEKPSEISRSLSNQPDVVITDGANPVRWLIKGFEGESKVLSTLSVVDTTGAGDAFMAGLLHQLLISTESKISYLNINKMISFASACGALVCGGEGAIDPQPTYDEVLKFLFD